MVETESESESAAETGTESESESESAAETESESEPEPETEPETVAEPEPETEPEPATGPQREIEPETEAAPHRAPPVLALAHRAADGRIFAELPGEERGERHERAHPLCGPPQCHWHLYAHRRSGPSGGAVTIVRPDGTICAGRLAGRVDLGVIDPYESPPPYAPAGASWRRAALVRGCTATDEDFLIAVYGVTPVEGLVRDLDAPARRAARAATRGGRNAKVWRFGGRYYVRVLEAGDTEDVFHVLDHGRRVESDRVSEHSEQCCDLVTGLVDLDGDGEPEVITLDGYPEDAMWVHVRVRGGALRWSAALAQGWFP